MHHLCDLYIRNIFYNFTAKSILKKKVTIISETVFDRPLRYYIYLLTTYFHTNADF